MIKVSNIDNFFKSQCKFIMGAAKYSQIKSSYLPEIAFIGRSKVGKSSLINALVNQKIALTSKTPGRTKQLNFFELGEKLILVDMPGYGFAKAGKNEVNSWDKLSYEYFAKRPNLKRIFILIDSRRGLLDKDKNMMNIFDSLAASYQIILTKIDELKEPQINAVKSKLEADSVNFPALHPKILLTSSNKSIGIKELRKEIINL